MRDEPRSAKTEVQIVSLMVRPDADLKYCECNIFEKVLAAKPIE
jgi:hypothetical protein